MSLLIFALRNARFLAFGAFATFFSSFGQTYVIALFNPEIRAAFSLTHFDFGLIYALATISSGTCLIWIGRLIDHVDLRCYLVAATAALATACLLLSWSPSVIFLGLALFALRLTGQGLMAHIGQTSMGRYFDRERGKAVSLAMTGAPIGAASFPWIVVALGSLYGWRGTWLVFAIFVAVVVAPLMLWLLRGHSARHAAYITNFSPPPGADPAMAVVQKQWTRRDVLRDYRFYLAVPAILAPSFIITGFFFHQLYIADQLGWSRAWVASTYIAYGGVTVVSALIYGPLIDRFGTVRLLPLNLVPLGLSMLWFGLSGTPAVGLGFMVASGITSGGTYTILGALWAEVYGTRHLGAIRAFAASLMVYSTAASPVSMGWLIDQGTGIAEIALVCLSYIVVGTLLVLFAYRQSGITSLRELQARVSVIKKTRD